MKISLNEDFIVKRLAIRACQLELDVKTLTTYMCDKGCYHIVTSYGKFPWSHVALPVVFPGQGEMHRKMRFLKDLITVLAFIASSGTYAEQFK